MARHPCCENMGVKKGPWTPEEDRILIAFIQRYGHENWRALPKQAGLLRCGKSCRLRWINYLRPDIKRGNFSREEEETIIKLHEKLGNRWSAIAAKLPGRTDNEIKNYWNTQLKKRGEQNQLIRNALLQRSTVMTPEWRRHDHHGSNDSSSDPERSPVDHRTFKAASDNNSSISAESSLNTNYVATTRLVTEKSSQATTNDAEIQGGKPFDQLSSSGASSFQGAAYPGLVLQSPSGIASVSGVDSGSNITNDMFFWYNVFINAEK